MEETVNTGAEINECTVIGKILNLTLNNLAFFKACKYGFTIS